jgi:hypothetical protein
MTFYAHRSLAYAPIAALSIVPAVLLVSPFVSQSAMSTEARTPLEPGRIVGGQPAGLFYYLAVTAAGSRRVDTRTWLFLPGNRVSRVYPYGGTACSTRHVAAATRAAVIKSGERSCPFAGTAVAWTSGPLPHRPKASVWTEDSTGPRVP